MSTRRPPLDNRPEPPTGRHHPVLANTVERSATTNVLPRLAPGRYIAIDNGEDVAVVELRGDQVTLGRGVWVNGKRVTRAIIHNEDSIALGSVRLRYIEIPDAGISDAD